jgi:hypothetical protein
MGGSFGFFTGGSGKGRSLRDPPSKNNSSSNREDNKGGYSSESVFFHFLFA